MAAIKSPGKKSPEKHLVILDAESATERDAMAERLSMDNASPAKGAVVLTMASIREELYKIPANVEMPDDAFAPELNLACKRKLIERTAELVREGKSVIVAADIKYDPMRAYMMGFAFAFDYKVHGFALDRPAAAAKGETEYRTDPVMKKYWRDITARPAPDKAYKAVRDHLFQPPMEPDTKNATRRKAPSPAR